MNKNILQSLPLNALRTFVVVARYESASKAAKELGVSHAAISQQLKILEEYLGILLFNRDAKRLRLTDLAKSYARDLQIVFSQMENATQRFYLQANPRNLTINVPISLSLHWLIPRIEGFYRQFPEIELQISTQQKTEFDPSKFDCVIYYGKTPPKELHHDLLFMDYLYPVMSSPLKLKKELIDINWMEYKFIYVTAKLRQQDWSIWCQAAGLPEPPKENRIYFADTPQALQAAIAGVGIAMAHEPLVLDAIHARRLQAISKLKLKLPFYYYFVCPKVNLKRDNINKFRHWLLNESKQSRND